MDRRKPANGGFDFTGHVRLVCADVIDRLPEFAHIDLDRVAIGFSQVRNAAAHGVQATLTPLRFEGGAATAIRRGRRYHAQRLMAADGRELLYIINFFLPRFMNTPLEEKIATIVHELWHISPHFDGDLRRFAGRCYAHGPSQQDYEAQVVELARKWWSHSPPAELYNFLRCTFADLQQAAGPIYGQKIRTPRLIPAER